MREPKIETGGATPEKREKIKHVFDQDLLEKYLGHPMMERMHLSTIGEFIKKEADKQGIDIEFSAPAGHGVPSDYLGPEGYQSPEPVSNFPVELLSVAYDRAKAMMDKANTLGYHVNNHYGANGNKCGIVKTNEYSEYIKAYKSENPLPDPEIYFPTWEDAEKWLLEKQK